MENLPPHRSFLAMTNLSDNDLRVFHHIDRELYGRLVIDIGFEKPESKEIMAFWLWLETVGHPNVIDRITAVSNNAVRMIAEEAQACLAYFRSGMDPNVLRDSNHFPITAGLLDRSISFRDFTESMSSGILEVLNEVSEKIFDDSCFFR
ncbi:hypothetical protein AMTR_s01092p00008390 [Amborella trichopoda]|uniref:Uncharacterized protein n=1 Tax=Amborella trichopoda TaxID=13333 RepID=U5DAI4_AMBTC|nr:hypothetical protein AMTR_s01092p00008390 [Amborella trichopoda]